MRDPATRQQRTKLHRFLARSGLPSWLARHFLAFAVMGTVWGQVATESPAFPVPGRAVHAAAPSVDIGGTPQGPQRTTIWRGRELTYEVINGWAVHDGDILLGRVEEVKVGVEGVGVASRSIPGPGLRRDSLSASRFSLWPDGVIPYEIIEDATQRELQEVHAAIAEWYARTAIKFVPRTGQSRYALLERPDDCPPRTCCSGIGSGFPQVVKTVGCGTSASVHELGHAIGLLHEHARTDAWEHVMAIAPLRHLEGYGWAHVHSVRDGPYDCRSVMHYGGFHGIPPGVPVQPKFPPSIDLGTALNPFESRT